MFVFWVLFCYYLSWLCVVNLELGELVMGCYFGVWFDLGVGFDFEVVDVLGRLLLGVEFEVICYFEEDEVDSEGEVLFVDVELLIGVGEV